MVKVRPPCRLPEPRTFLPLANAAAPNATPTATAIRTPNFRMFAFLLGDGQPCACVRTLRRRARPSPRRPRTRGERDRHGLSVAGARTLVKLSPTAVAV